MDEYGDEAVQNLHFFYDAQSRPAFVEYNGAKYRYLHNLQGDIIGIVDGNGNLVVEYRYDAWGKPILTTGTLKTSLGELNPFRYRGYVWDTESGLYYLRSRYYNMITCRFINKDDYYGELAQCYPHNLFCYCANTPICYSDRNGRYPVNVSEIKQYFEYIGSLIKRLKEKIKSIKEVIRKTRGNYPCIPERATPKISAGIKYISKNSVKSEDITGIMIGKFPKIGGIISDLSSIMGAGQPKLNSGTYGFIQYSYEWAYIAADGTIHPQYVRATQYFTADPSSEDIFVYEDELVDPFNLVTPLMEVYY